MYAHTYVFLYACIYIQTFIFTRKTIASEISWHTNEMNDESSLAGSELTIYTHTNAVRQPSRQPVSQTARQSVTQPNSQTTSAVVVVFLYGLYV